jgi:hypothetical protein
MPTKLLGGLAAMAVGASNIALRDLGHEIVPGRNHVVRPVGDGIAFLASDMIELQDHRVGLTTINAGVRGEVVVEFLSEGIAPCRLIATGPNGKPCTVGCVVLFDRFPLTELAPVVEPI